MVLFRDIVENYYKWYPHFSIEEVKKRFDLVMSYNPLDCEKYGLVYFLVEAPAKLDIKKEADYPESDLFCAIVDKGRTELVLKCYDKAVEAGYKPLFFIQGKATSEKEREGVIYLRKMMPYCEYVRHLVNTKCLLEIVQPGTVSYTNRVKEALIYNKRIITNCPLVKELKYYPSPNILFAETIEDFDPGFLGHDDEVNYKYDGDFSAENVLKTIEDFFSNY